MFIKLGDFVARDDRLVRDGRGRGSIAWVF